MLPAMPNTRSSARGALWGAGIVALVLALAGSATAAPPIDWELVATHPHDPDDYTQGLVWHEGRLFESTGQYGHSRLLEKDLKTGRRLRSVRLPDTQFAEGLAVVHGELWQLTWREGLAHVYDLALKPRRQLRYRGEGWGLASDGEQLVISDGSARLHFVEVPAFRLRRSVDVRDGAATIDRLNELEWFGGAILANVWFSDRVARIDPDSGTVTGWLDLSPLKTKAGITPAQEANGAVLNGLAYRPETGTLLVTGKLWPRLFELRLKSDR